MKTMKKIFEIYQTLDFKVFTDRSEAIDHEEKIIADFNQHLNLSKYILPGEIFCRFEIDQKIVNGTFTVTKIEERKITVVDEYNETHVRDYSNWHIQYLHQIYSDIEYCRGWRG